MTCRTLLVACLLATACAAPAPDPVVADAPPFELAAARREIEQLNARFTDAHVRGDSLTIDSLFTADARSLPPGAAEAVGIAAIHALTMAYLEGGVSEFREVTTDFYGDANLVVDQGTYVMTYGPDRVTERGKYLNVWVPVNGSWRIRTNIWNADATVP